MSYSFSILTSSGYPFYTKKILDEPLNTSLNMRFYDFVHSELSYGEQGEQSFELQAGLVSALYEFARVLGYPIELLKFKTVSETNLKDDGDNLVPFEVPINSDVLLTSRTESFLIPTNFEAKIHLIYKYIITAHIPLGPEKRITDANEQFILELLKDKGAIALIEKNKEELDKVCNKTLEEYKKYGLEAIVIASFDANPLKTYNIEKNNVLNIFREIGIMPLVKDYQWKYRLVSEKGLFIINSGCGVKNRDIFMPFYYILICSKEAFLGDSPTTIYNRINSVLNEE
jgi:hypothetical protein